jgi:hypothetical protein
VIRSRDGGKTWHRLPSHTRRGLRSAVVHPRTGDLILVGERVVRLTLN